MKKLLCLLLLAFAPLAHAVTCDQWAVGSDTASGLTQIVALQTGKSVYVCSWSVTTAVTTANSAQLQYGTGSACATGTGSLSLIAPLQAITTQTAYSYSYFLPANANWQTPLNNALCLNLGAATNVNYQINYAVQ
jgi:hypothetical protein